jgi:hypothetical protein
VRDGKCAEAAMWLVHHVSASGRAEIAELGLAVPALEPHRANATDAPARAHNASAPLVQTYDEQYNCVTGHNNVGGSSPDDGAPHWPDGAHYQATGHGPYPFWMGPVNYSDINDGVAIESWWSQSQSAELLSHASCALANAGASDGVACKHLMIGQEAYLYTADETFCCKSGDPDMPAQKGFGAQILTPVQYDWMDKMTLQGTTENYVGDYYSGAVLNYTLDCTGNCGPGSFHIW